MSLLIKRVEQYMADNQMVCTGDHLIVGVSGGTDSMCLLFVLHALSEKLSLKLTAVHINHGLRGADADEDQAFVEHFCEGYHIDYICYTTNIRTLAKEEHLSEEEAGRSFRYRCFEQARTERGAQKVAVAHHQDDLSETVLFNIFRGTGLDGLAGILPVRDQIIRPLLCLSRREIEAMLMDEGIPFRTDQTNFAATYSRNRIRLDILPYVREHINAGVDGHLTQLAAMAVQLKVYLKYQQEQVYEGLQNPDGGLRTDPLGALEPIILREVIRRWIQEQAGGLKDISQVHIEAIIDLVYKPVGRQLHLPYGIVVMRTYDSIEFIKNGKNREEEHLCPGEVDIRTPGQYICPPYSGTIEVLVENADQISKFEQNSYTKCFDYDKIESSLKLRYRQPGDYMVMNTRGERKLLRRILIDEKIPRASREQMLLVADGAHILWLVGVKTSCAYQMNDETARLLVIKIKGEE